MKFLESNYTIPFGTIVEALANTAGVSRAVEKTVRARYQHSVARWRNSASDSVLISKK